MLGHINAQELGSKFNRTHANKIRSYFKPYNWSIKLDHKLNKVNSYKNKHLNTYWTIK